MTFRMTLLTLGLFLGSTVSARADLIIAIDDLALQQGSTGTLNVSITNTGSSAVDIDSFAFRFQISTSGPSQLSFTPTQTDPFGRSDYLFFGNSLDQNAGTSLGSVGTTVTPSDTYTGGDNTNDGNEVVLSGSKYLTSLQVTALTGVPPASGALFTIGLETTDPQGNPATFFSGAQGEVAYQATGGLVTIVPASVVPEPTSWLLLTVGAMLSIGGRLQKRLF